ncbi:MAG: sugar ABC transporter permease [Chloroflexi bacterium]|nr:sugar ABC transporter permease [Chloroflexota bacterium]
MSTPVARSSAMSMASSPFGWFTQQGMRGMARREALTGYLFILPTYAGFLLFVFGPVIASLGLSFYDWDLLAQKAPRFVGAQNFANLTQDARLLTAFRNTLLFVAGAVGLEVSLAVILAVAVQSVRSRPLTYFLRTAFFLPLTLSGAAVAVVLSYLFQREFGVINYYVALLGFERIPWLNSASWSLVAVIFAATWRSLGFNFIIFVAGVQNISRDMYEAADIDGAGPLAKFFNVTLPLLSPTMLFVTVIGVIGALQVFEQPFVMTRGGPGDSSRTVVMIIYESAFQNLAIGYGAAIASLLFLLIMALTVVQFWLSKRWVHYD